MQKVVKSANVTLEKGEEANEWTLKTSQMHFK